MVSAKTRVLALSDIHGNVGVVSRLREREPNSYDLIIIAGDIGARRAREICDILDTFGCPVAYVYGNHDHNLPYNFDLGANGHHLHGNPLVIDNICLVGFSGCPTNWGLNPISAQLSAAFDREEQTTHAQVLADLKAIDALKPNNQWRARERMTKSKAFLAYDGARKAFWRNIVAENRSELATALRQVTRPGLFNFAVTHERLTKAELLPEVDCLVHGHIHRFSNQISKGKRQLNVAALDKPMAVWPTGSGDPLGSLCNIDTGNYVTFEIAGRSMQNLTLKSFGWNEEGWSRFDNTIVRGGSVKSVGADPSRDSEAVVQI